MNPEEIKTLLTDKRINETVQLVVVSIAVAFVLFQIPSCVKTENVNDQNKRAAVKIAAIEAGLVQKRVKRNGTSYTDIIWTKPNEDEVLE